LNNIDRIGGNIGSAKGAVETGSNTIIENISTIGSTNDAQSGKVTTNLGQGLGSVGSAIGSVKNMFKR
jgi:hypothetical protein